jgi:hypothetical protein
MSQLLEAGKFKDATGRALTAWFRFAFWVNSVRDGGYRVAMARHALELIRKGNRPVWASDLETMRSLYAYMGESEGARREELEHEIAAKLANEALVDYQMTSRYGVQASRYLVPFWRWMFGNPSRYFNLIRNEIKTGGKAAGLRAAGGAARVAYRSAILMAAVQGGIFLWNETIKATFGIGDEEDPNKRDANRQFILMGRNPDGTVRGLPAQAAFADVLAWVNAQNTIQDIASIREGRGGEVLEDALVSAPNKLINSLRPDLHLLFGFITGIRSFPDPLRRPGKIKDQGENLAQVMGLSPIYRMMNGIPRGGTNASELWSLVGYSFNPGEADFYDTQALAWRWKENMGKAGGGGKMMGQTLWEWVNGDKDAKKTVALARMKASMAAKNPEGVKIWHDAYMQSGGTKEGLKTSLRSLDPLYPIAQKDRNAFLESMTPKERERYNRARAWSEKVLNSPSQPAR